MGGTWGRDAGWTRGGHEIGRFQKTYYICNHFGGFGKAHALPGPPIPQYHRARHWMALWIATINHPMPQHLRCKQACKHVERLVLNMQSSDVVFLQNNGPINVHQAMTKERKVSILFKGILGTKSPLQIQASLKYLLWLFPRGRSQRKYHHFHGIAGRGGRTRGGRGEGTLNSHSHRIHAPPTNEHSRPGLVLGKSSRN